MTYWTLHLISEYLDQCKVDYDYSMEEVFFISWFGHYCWIAWRDEKSNRIGCRPFDSELARGVQNPDVARYLDVAELSAETFRNLLISVMDSDWPTSENPYREEIAKDLTPAPES